MNVWTCLNLVQFSSRVHDFETYSIVAIVQLDIVLTVFSNKSRSTVTAGHTKSNEMNLRSRHGMHTLGFQLHGNYKDGHSTRCSPCAVGNVWCYISVCHRNKVCWIPGGISVRLSWIFRDPEFFTIQVEASSTHEPPEEKRIYKISQACMGLFLVSLHPEVGRMIYRAHMMVYNYEGMEGINWIQFNGRHTSCDVFYVFPSTPKIILQIKHLN